MTTLIPPSPLEAEETALMSNPIQGKVYQGHTGGISSVKFSSFRPHIFASCAADKTIRVWNTTTNVSTSSSTTDSSASSSSSSSTPGLTSSKKNDAVHTLEGHTQGVSDIAWSPDGQYLASASDDGTVRLWNVETGKQACKPLRGHENYVVCVDFNPRANIIATGSYDESVRLWDLRTSRCIRAIPAHSEPITAVQFHPDGSFLVTGSYDGLVRFWDPTNGQCLTTLHEKGTPPIGSVRFSPNGKYILTSSLDSRVRLWDYVTSKRVRTYEGYHINTNVAAIATFLTVEPSLSSSSLIDPRSTSLVSSGTTNTNKAQRPLQRIIAASEDGKPAIYDADSKNYVSSLEGHNGGVAALDVFRNTIVTGGIRDPTVRLWTIDE